MIKINLFNKKYIQSIAESVKTFEKEDCVCGQCLKGFQYPDLTNFDNDLIDMFSKLSIDHYEDLENKHFNNNKLISKIFSVSEKNIFTEGILSRENIDDLFKSSEFPFDEIVRFLLIPENLKLDFMSFLGLDYCHENNNVIAKLWSSTVIECPNIKSEYIVSISSGGRVHSMKVVI